LVVAQSNRPLTDQGYWDGYWENLKLPVEVTRRGGTQGDAILDVFDRYLPRDPDMTAAELGGAPGQYLAYVHRSRGYSIACIDYSKVGCDKAIQNFDLLGIPGEVIQADLFADTPDLPRFDVVYSLGLIEHFRDSDAIVARHLRLVKPGGYLVLGVPNFQGLTGWFVRRLRPSVYAALEVSAMNIGNWRSFEDSFGLETAFKDYIGGFEPRIFRSRLEPKRRDVPLAFALAVVLDFLIRGPLRFLRRFNGSMISGYAMAVYRVPRHQ
jgi:SAM-dependent methyltransferase